MVRGIRLLGVSSFRLVGYFGALKRYIASYGGPAKFAGRLHKSPEKWNATGDLKFLNEW